MSNHKPIQRWAGLCVPSQVPGDTDMVTWLDHQAAIAALTQPKGIRVPAERDALAEWPDDPKMHKWVEGYNQAIREVVEMNDVSLPRQSEAVGYACADGSVTFYVDDFSYSRKPQAGTELFTTPQPAQGDE